ncbi:MAG: type II toxin-antitoxin system RelE/ParE family toxin [Stenotrophobium sp.]
MNSPHFHPEANAELTEAVHFYEQKSPGLGKALAHTIESALIMLGAHPEAAPKLRGRLRVKPINKFPYSLIYAFERNHLAIYAVMHQRQKPYYWLQRLKN